MASASTSWPSTAKALYVLELKKDKTPREVVAQALEYGFWITGLSYDDIVGLYAKHNQGDDFASAFSTHFEVELPESINAAHELVVMAWGMIVRPSRSLSTSVATGCRSTFSSSSTSSTAIASTWLGRGSPTPNRTALHRAAAAKSSRHGTAQTSSSRSVRTTTATGTTCAASASYQPAMARNTAMSNLFEGARV
ncbi:MAG: hypothetical protein LC777_09580, partial [Actinobacteria bacterium]|nr:hypothetical protein [Actinomycetota bacterium]